MLQLSSLMLNIFPNLALLHGSTLAGKAGNKYYYVGENIIMCPNEMETSHKYTLVQLPHNRSLEQKTVLLICYWKKFA